MINLLKFSDLFESVNYSYTIDDVKALPTFKVLETLGFTDSTTNAIWSHGNMRLYNNELDMNAPDTAITIYQNGPIRKSTASFYRNVRGINKGNPHILKEFDAPIQNLNDWNSRFLYILSWAKKRYKRYKSIDLGHFDRVPKDKLGEYLVSAYKGDIDNFLMIYPILKKEEKELFLSAINLESDEFDKIIDRYKSFKSKLPLI